MRTSSVFGRFISGESETKPIKPINHEQPIAGYVAIPPRDLTDPDLRAFSDSLLFESTDTVPGPELTQHLPFTRAPERSQIWTP